MNDGYEDTSLTGRVTQNRKAALDPNRGLYPRAGKPSPSVAGVMLLATLCGAFLGGVIGSVFLPSFFVALLIGGAMTGASVAAALLILRPQAEMPPPSGRSEAEVQAALDEIRKGK